MRPFVTSVNISAKHTFSKSSVDSITLLKGLGVAGDAHCGEKMKHRSRVKVKPIPPNLRQVHLIHTELFEELKDKGFSLEAGQIGENITTRDIDLLGLPRGAKLRIGDTAVIEITGLRNPCDQLNHFQDGLLSAVIEIDEQGNVIRKAGIMGIVLEGGEVKVGDSIYVELPEKPFLKLERV